MAVLLLGYSIDSRTEIEHDGDSTISELVLMYEEEGCDLRLLTEVVENYTMSSECLSILSTLAIQDVKFKRVADESETDHGEQDSQED